MINSDVMYTKDNQLYVAHSENGPICISGMMANRHGLVAGATGTGKTVTLQVLAETFSQAGVPCFMADMKGDLSGISQAGGMSSFIGKRCAEFGIGDPAFEGCPVRFYDVFGEQGFPMRATISSMGPQLIARLLELNEIQTGVLNIVFRVADEKGLLLIDLKDLRMMLDFVARNASDFTTAYGNISQSSIGAIQRALLVLENQGADKFFGEPEFNIHDLMATDRGRGVMSVLAADRLMMQPKLYSTFLLWLLDELYSELPEVGDLDLPKLVFFFDEAHMLFDGTSKALLDKIEQVIRLIRSKGVGIYFVTQSPTDIPDNILGQLGNRVQHALRAYTPKEQKAVRAAAETFRANPAFKTEDVILELATGEALVSFLDEKGAPRMVERARILFPLSQIGAVTEAQRSGIMAAAPAAIRKYEDFFDRESAYETLTALYAKAEEIARRQQEEVDIAKEAEAVGKQRSEEQREADRRRKTIQRSILGTMIGAAATSFARSVGTSVAKSITGSSKSSSSKSKTSTTASGTLKKAARKGVEQATTQATKKVVNDILKGLLK